MKPTYSCVVPIYKKGDNHSIANYRPIALTSCFSKVFEYCFLETMLSFLSKHALISESQHGFRSGRSTETAFYSFYCKVLEWFDAAECPVGIFCDLSRAFDCVDHKNLITKLERYGFGGMAAGDWVKSYLSHRKQYVSIQHRVHNTISKHYSDSVDVSFGVPQGSVLGPALFLLYINDLNMCLDGTGVATTMYAADTTFLLSSKDDRSLEARCGEVLGAAAAWFGQNSLYLNEEKTTYIRFHPHQKQLNTNFQLSTGSGNIKPTDTVKFLDIWVDKNFNFKNHCQHLIGRLNSACYLFRNLRVILALTQIFIMLKYIRGSDTALLSGVYRLYLVMSSLVRRESYAVWLVSAIALYPAEVFLNSLEYLR